MNEPTAPREQIFAAIAWQAALIDDAQICELLAANPGDHPVPPSQRAQDRGWITPAERTALEAVATALLARCDQDANRALALLKPHADWQAGTVLAAAADARSGREAPRTPSTLLQSKLSENDSTAPSTAKPLDHSSAPQPLAEARFRLLRPHASGGLGIVWIAHDRELDRLVALKEIKGSVARDPNARLRFVREAEITGKLEHPGIVPIYSLGTHLDGQPYYAMRLIEGESLRDAITRFHAAKLNPRDHALALRDLLERFLHLCDAIAYAHSRGVLHRDLKPSNVMLGRFGETIVVDWGLARADGAPAAASPTPSRSVSRSAGPDNVVNTGQESAATVLGPVRVMIATDPNAATEAGAVLGTPFFMSPEQARGDIAALGPATDIYGLGATLHTILVGRSPGETPTAADHQPPAQHSHTEAPVVAPPRALMAICRKAMAQQAEHRYANVMDLAADVRRFLADEAVTAAPEPWLDRLTRLARRYRNIAATAAAALLLIALTLAWAYKRESSNARQLAQLNKKLAAEHKRADNARRLADSRLDRAVETIRDVLAEATPIIDPPKMQAASDLARHRLAAVANRFFQSLARETSSNQTSDPREYALLAEARLGLGRAAELTGNLPQARREYLSGIDALSSIESDAATSQRRADLHAHLGNVLLALGEPTAASGAFQEAIFHHRGPGAPAVGLDRWRARLDQHHARLGEALRKAGKAKIAGETALQRLAIWPTPDARALLVSAGELSLCATLLEAGNAEERRLATDFANQAATFLERALRMSSPPSTIPWREIAVPAIAHRPETRLVLTRWLSALWPPTPFAQAD